MNVLKEAVNVAKEALYEIEKFSGLKLGLIQLGEFFTFCIIHGDVLRVLIHNRVKSVLLCKTVFRNIHKSKKTNLSVVFPASIEAKFAI